MPQGFSPDLWILLCWIIIEACSLALLLKLFQSKQSSSFIKQSSSRSSHLIHVTAHKCGLLVFLAALFLCYSPCCCCHLSQNEIFVYLFYLLLFLKLKEVLHFYRHALLYFLLQCSHIFLAFSTGMLSV